MKGFQMVKQMFWNWLFSWKKYVLLIGKPKNLNEIIIKSYNEFAHLEISPVNYIMQNHITSKIAENEQFDTLPAF